MTAAAVEDEEAELPTCWCCGNTVDESRLTRLGNHPEVGVCERCARWLGRRARAAADEGKPSPAALVRQGIQLVRRQVVRVGAQDWPMVGPLLRSLDRHLP